MGKICERHGATILMPDGCACPSWGTLLPLVLENVGGLLAYDSRADALRARLVSKHWNACITRCIKRVTLYGNAVLLPLNEPLPPGPLRQHHHLHEAAQDFQRPAPSNPVLIPSGESTDYDVPTSLQGFPQPPNPYPNHTLAGSMAQCLTHARVRGKEFDVWCLRLMARDMPSLTSLSLQASSYSMNPIGVHGMPGLPNKTTTVAVPAPTTAAGVAGAPWPPAPPQLRKLHIHVNSGVPPDVLRWLFLEPPAAGPGLGVRLREDTPTPTAAATFAAMPALQPPQSHATAPAPSPLRMRVLALQELAIMTHPLAQLDAPTLYIDLTPLLDPRLSGVTKLTSFSLAGRQAAPAQAAPNGAAPGALAAQQQHHHHHQQQQQTSGEGTQKGEDLDPVQVLSRMNQLRSLSVQDLVELPSFGPQCLTQLSGLQELRLSAVFCETASDLNHLVALTRLTSLSLNFGTEWWIDAGDLRVLSRLVALRKLELSVDYGCDLQPVDFSDEMDVDAADDEPYSDEDDDKEPGGASSHSEAEPLKSTGPSTFTRMDTVDVPYTATPYSACTIDEQTLPSGGYAGAASLMYISQEISSYVHSGEGRRGCGQASALGARDADPGSYDDWRRALGSLTQLRDLSLRFVAGGGRHLAEALHGSTWLSPSHSGGVEGATVALDNAPASALLDVTYWSRVAAPAVATAVDGQASLRPVCAAAAAAVASTPLVPFGPPSTRPVVPAAKSHVGSADGFPGLTASAAEGAGSGASAPPPRLPPAFQPRAPPIVTLRLGAGRELTLSYAHVLCIALMTELRTLQLSYEAARPPSPIRRVRVRQGSAGGEVGACRGYPSNPLLALSRLRNLRFLDIRIKQPFAAPNAAECYSTFGQPALSPLDDSVVEPWLKGMPELLGLRLRGVGRLGEKGLGAIGRHKRLQLLALQLKVPSSPSSPPPQADVRHEVNRSSTGPDTSHVAGTPASGTETAAPSAANALPPADRMPLSSHSGIAGALLRIGYGSYYALGCKLTASAVGGRGSGGGSSGDGGERTSLGLSPPPPGTTAAGSDSGGSMSYGTGSSMLARSLPGGPVVPSRSVLATAAVAAPASGSKAAWPAPMQAGFLSAGAEPRTSPVLEPFGGALLGAAEGAATAVMRERLLGAGMAVSPELLTGVPYIIRPHHLPPSLTVLDLTNAAFSSDWADFHEGVTQPPAGPAAASSSVSAGEPATGSAATASAAKAPATSPQQEQQRSIPRLSILRLVRRGGGRGVQLAGNPGAAAAASGSAGAPAPAPQPGCPPPDPTHITDWHLVHLLASQPTLTSLALEDKDAGDAAGPAAKLHYRAVAQLGRLRYLERLNLAVGNRLRWRAQEALFSSLTPGLRSLRLDASHLYKEAVAGCTRLTNLKDLEILGYAEANYIPELEAVLKEVQSHLPECDIMTVYVQAEDAKREASG